MRKRSYVSPIRVELLEGREVPAALVGLTADDELITFDSGSPGTVSSAIAIQGLKGTENLVGIDFRPSSGQLYGVVFDTATQGNNGRLVIIDPGTGTTTALGTGYTFTLTGSAFGVDFNPVPDLVRILSDSGQSLRINPGTGALAGTDTSPFLDPTNDVDNGFTNPAFFDDNADGDFDPSTNPPILPTLNLSGAGYTRNAGATAGKFVTTLYAIDSMNDLLVRVGGPGGVNPDGTPNNPNFGKSYAIDFLRNTATFEVVDFGPQNGFDIENGTDLAFAIDSKSSKLYQVDLTSGGVTSLGTVGGDVALRGLSIAPPQSGPGTIQLAASSLTFPANRSPLAVTVTRTGGATGTVMVDYATSDGTARGGTDYLPASGTLTFAEGQTSRQLFLFLPAGTVGPADSRTFTLTLSNATGGATLGANTTATVTIPPVGSTTPRGRLFATGQGSGGDQVAIYDAVTGDKLFAFSAFGGGFTGGVRVATGDVNGDGFDDLLVGAGPGGGPRVTVFDGSSLSATSQTILANFFAYEASFTGGVYVAAGDINGDGFDDLVLGSGFGGGPRVRVLDGDSLTSETQTVLTDFFAYESTFRGGVFVAAGEFTGDGKDDIVTGASIGGGPRVQVFDSSTQTPVANYFAYDESFRDGVYVAAGDINGDGILDVITGPGTGGSPLIRAFSGTTNKEVAAFFAFEEDLRRGAPIATTDLEADGRAEILVGYGIGGPVASNQAAGQGTVRVFDAAGTEVRDPLVPFGENFMGGVFIG